MKKPQSFLDKVLSAIIGICFIALACVLFFEGMASFTEILMRHPETNVIFGLVFLYVGYKFLSLIFRRRSDAE